MSDDGNESIMDKIKDAVHKHSSSSSSSDNESHDSHKKDSHKKDSHKKDSHKDSLPKKKRLFGRQNPVHAVFGGGKSADIILWRNKQFTGSMFTGATVIWLLFEWIGYHLLTFMCHSLILTLAMLFLWSNLSSFVNKNPLDLPDITLPEDTFVNLALMFREQFHQAFTVFREVAHGNDLKQFLYVILGLWIISVVGGWFNFLTLVYLVFVMTLTLPLVYEMHEDRVDSYAELAKIELKKQYDVLDEKVIRKLPKVPFINDHKKH